MNQHPYFGLRVSVDLSRSGFANIQEGCSRDGGVVVLVNDALVWYLRDDGSHGHCGLGSIVLDCPAEGIRRLGELRPKSEPPLDY